ncbi:MAG: class I SAM-dependent methyltransferase [Lachnospiraceae bacterium]|nr:class I SAM-dependent methyltransferase [Lachnospiraceae bacterium]
MKLSKRLSAVAAMVTPGMVLADIGTDHAYIPIDLVERGVIPRAIAADVNPGPLKRAAEHIRTHGLADRISTRLCDGLSAFEAGEVQSVVIAGMGGALTAQILQDGGHLLGDDLCEPSGEVCLRRGEPEAGEACQRTGVYAAKKECRQVQELVLQPQSEIFRVRFWLWQNGWEIVQEDMVFEDGKYYPMMKARHVETQWTAAAVSADLCRKLCLEFGPKLLEEKNPVLWTYLQKEKAAQERILDKLSRQKSPAAVSRACEIREKLSLTEEALKLFSQL